MMAIVGPLLAAALVAQAQPDKPRTGEVVDGQGKPVAGARVIFYSPPVGYGKGDPVEVETRTDAAGKFSLKVPPLKRILVNGVNYLAYHPGLSITAQAFFRPPIRLALEKPVPRTVRVVGPDGSSIAGATVRLRLLYVFNKAIAIVPSSMADALATTTGSDGTTTLNYVAPRDQVAAVRVSADSIGTQDILLIERPNQDLQESPITITLKKTTHLAGRIVDPNSRPVQNHPVQVLSMGGGGWLGPNTVEFKDGPLRTGADGSFRTPDISWSVRAIASPSSSPAMSQFCRTGSRSATSRKRCPRWSSIHCDRSTDGSSTARGKRSRISKSSSRVTDPSE